jgi:hypothetical protein
MPLEGVDVDGLVGVEGRDERCVDALRNEAAKLGCGSVTSISISERHFGDTCLLTSR